MNTNHTTRNSRNPLNALVTRFLNHVESTAHDSLHAFAVSLVGAICFMTLCLSVLTDTVSIWYPIKVVLAIATLLCAIYRMAYAIAEVKVKNIVESRQIATEILNVHLLASSLINQHLPVPEDLQNCIASLEEIQSVADGLVTYYAHLLTEQEGRLSTMFANNPPTDEIRTLENIKNRLALATSVENGASSVLNKMRART